MATVRKGDREEKVELTKTKCLIEAIIRISGDNSGQGVEVFLSKEEDSHFSYVGRIMLTSHSVGELIYVNLLYSLEVKSGKKPKGFHWDYNPAYRCFRTYTFGLYD